MEIEIVINASFIPLTQDKVAIVDKEDFDELNKWKWNVTYGNKNGKHYAKRAEYIGTFDGKKKVKTIRMHRELMNAPKGKVIDHINHNTLDNRKSNLRVVSQRQNCQNYEKKGTSKYPGVSWNSINKKWTATILIKQNIKNLGYFEDERDAAKAYEEACRELGEELVCKVNRGSA